MKCCFWTMKRGGFAECDKRAETHWTTPLGTVLSYCGEHFPDPKWGLKPATEQEALVAEVQAE